MNLRDFFVSTTILDGPLTGKNQVILRLLFPLVKAGVLTGTTLPEVAAAILHREQLGSTGIGGGLALPNARHAAVPRPLGVFAVCRPALEFDSLDGQPVEILALCLRPPLQSSENLAEALRPFESMVRCFRQDNFLPALRRAREPWEISAVLWTEGKFPFGPCWSDPTVVRVAQTIHESRNFCDLPILADALEDAGCTDAALLDHFRCC
jgi:mannitol/fructose-specific phosphotransferase system IIA component (Ntr-type)